MNTQPTTSARPATVPVEPGRPSTVRPDLEPLLARLEASFEFHTEQLARLTATATDDPEELFTRASLVASSRQALSVIAAALRDMADGSYGRCEGCGQDIPLERLEARPEARYCVGCQAKVGR